jgi:hypothetical protein
MTYMPDPANQFHLLACGVLDAPENSHLADPVGSVILSDIFSMKNNLEN